MSTPVKNGRGVLSQLPNGVERSASPHPQQKGNPGSSPHPAKKPPLKLNIRPEPGNLPLATNSSALPQHGFVPASPAIPRKPTVSSLANKRARTSPHTKRVSFGGDTVNIINQHRDEFASPDDDFSGSLGVSSPPRKVMRDSWASPGRLQSPMFVRADPDLDPRDEDSENEDTVTIPDVKTAIASTSMQAKSLLSDGMTMAPVPMQVKSAGSNARGTPVPVRRNSVITKGDRRSFGIFLDDDVASGDEEVNDVEEGDKTRLDMGFGNNLEPGVPSSDDSDSDITQNITALLDLEREGEDEPTITIRHPPPADPRGPSNASNRRQSRASSRKSLSYIVPQVDQSQQQVPTVQNKGRWSLMPLSENDNFLADNKPRRDSMVDTDETVKISDFLNQVDEDEMEEEAFRRQQTAPTVSASPVVALPRPLPPDNRQLFDSAEDPTIHFYPEEPGNKGGPEVGKKESRNSHAVSPTPLDHGPMVREDGNDREQAQSSSIPQGIFRKSLLKKSVEEQPVGFGVSESIWPTTPMSATGERVRSLREKGSSSLRKNPFPSRHLASSSAIEATANLEVLSKFRLREDLTVCAKALKPKPFTVADFLHAGKLVFAGQVALDNRRPSISPAIHSVGIVDRSGVDWKILESVKRAKVLEKLQVEVAKHLHAVEEASGRVASHEQELVQTCPPVWEKLMSRSSVSRKDLHSIQNGLKRLQKITARDARLAWARSRQEMEENILNALKSVSVALRADTESAARAATSFVNGTSEFKSRLKATGQSMTKSVADDAETLENARRQLLREFTRVSELRRNISCKKKLADECQANVQLNAPEREKLLTRQETLQAYAAASTDNKLNKMLATRKELNTIVCGVSSLRPTKIRGDAVHVILAEMMDLHMELKDDRIAKVISRPVHTLTDCKPVAAHFVDGAVELVRKAFGKFEQVRQVSFYLFTCSRSLGWAWTRFLEAEQYFSAHLGGIAEASVDGDVSNCLDLTMRASFYSLRERMKFDLEVVVSTIFPDPKNKLPFQKVKGIEVTRFIGTAPSDELLEEEVRISGFQADENRFSVSDAFGAVWKLL